MLLKKWGKTLSLLLIPLFILSLRPQNSNHLSYKMFGEYETPWDSSRKSVLWSSPSLFQHPRCKEELKTMTQFTVRSYDATTVPCGNTDWHRTCHPRAIPGPPLCLLDNQQADERSQNCEDSLRWSLTAARGGKMTRSCPPTCRGLNDSQCNLMHYSLGDAVPGAISKREECHGCQEWGC